MNTKQSRSNGKQNLARVCTIACTIVTLLARLQANADSSSSSSWAPPPPPLALHPHLLPLLLLMVHRLPYQMKSMSLALFHFYLLAYSPTKIYILALLLQQVTEGHFLNFFHSLCYLFFLFLADWYHLNIFLGGRRNHPEPNKTRNQSNGKEKSKGNKKEQKQKCLLFFLGL